MSTKYIDRNGNVITKERWKELRADESYCTVCAYDNGVVNVKVRWSGVVHKAENLLPAYWTVFYLLVYNYKTDGTMVVDPVDSDQPFATEAAAAEAYASFLSRWTESEYDGETLIEVDNTLEPVKPPEPPAPPDPNKPSSTSEELGEEGAW